MAEAPSARADVVATVRATLARSELEWDEVGDGSVYDGIEAAGVKASDVITDSARSKEEYGKSIQYSVTSLTQWLERYGTDGGPLHDPNVIAFLIRPEIYRGRLVNVEVETESELTMGQTVVDWWGATDRPRNVHYITEVDDTALFDLLVERIGRL